MEDRIMSGNSRLKFCGFTLIEMLVVLSVVSLLLTIAVPKFFSSIDKSKSVILQQDLKVLRDSIDKFYADNGYFPASLNDLVNKKYIKGIPVDPITESSATWVEILSDDDSNPGVVDVKSGASGFDFSGKSYGEM